MGRYPLVDMPEYYSLADVMLISLKREYIFSLTIPAKLQSYLACGKPILAMLDGEAPKIIKEANAGLTCKSEDADRLADNILKMYSLESNHISQMGVNALNLYTRMFSRNTLLNQAEQIFHRMINYKHNTDLK